LLGRLWIEKKGKSQRPSLCAIESHSIIRSIFDFFLVVACGSLKHFLAHVHASSLELELEDWHESWSLLTLYRSLVSCLPILRLLLCPWLMPVYRCIHICIYVYVHVCRLYKIFKRTHIHIIYIYISALALCLYSKRPI